MKELFDREELKQELTAEQYEEYIFNLETYGQRIAIEMLPELSEKFAFKSAETNSIHNRRIKELRLDNKLTQTDVANVLDISQREYWRYEQEGYSPSISKLSNIALFYNVSLDWISGISDEKKPVIKEKEIYDGVQINGYVLKKMKIVKEKGEKYEPFPEKRIAKLSEQ